MSTANPENPKVTILSEGEKTVIQISALAVTEPETNAIIQGHTAILQLFEKTSISQVYYVDDIFELVDDVNQFLGLIETLITEGKKEELASKFTEINFDDPGEVVNKNLLQLWNDNEDKRHKYLTKLITITGNDTDFKKDIGSLVRIEHYLPETMALVKLTPSQWLEQHQELLLTVQDGEKALVLFDYSFKHSPEPVKQQTGLDFIDAVVKSDYSDKVLCGLLTHTTEIDREEGDRKDMVAQSTIPFEKFFLLSKKRTDKPIPFADGIKKALLNSSCEIIKSKIINMVKSAQATTISKLEKIDAYAFDHMIINSSYHEGVWEPETIFRINDFLFADAVRNEILSNQQDRQTINEELEIARSIGRIPVADAAYIDHLELRHQELYSDGRLINGLNSPLRNGDLFEITDGRNTEKYILVVQPCDVMVRKEGTRKLAYGSLLKLSEKTEASLRKEVGSFYKANPLRQHFFADKYKLPYYIASPEVKFGIIDFNSIALIDMEVLDLVVFNEAGNCTIDLNAAQVLNTKIQSSWRKRRDFITHKFSGIRDAIIQKLAAVDPLSEQVKNEIRHHFMPVATFTERLGIKENYVNGVFDFGIKRVGRYKEPFASLLLNRYNRFVSREAEGHDFAEFRDE